MSRRVRRGIAWLLHLALWVGLAAAIWWLAIRGLYIPTFIVLLAGIGALLLTRPRPAPERIPS